MLNHSTQEVEAGGLPQIQGQCVLLDEFLPWLGWSETNQLSEQLSCCWEPLQRNVFHYSSTFWPNLWLNYIRYLRPPITILPINTSTLTNIICTPAERNQLYCRSGWDSGRKVKNSVSPWLQPSKGKEFSFPLVAAFVDTAYCKGRTQLVSKRDFSLQTHSLRSQKRCLLPVFLPRHTHTLGAWKPLEVKYIFSENWFLSNKFPVFYLAACTKHIFFFNRILKKWMCNITQIGAHMVKSLWSFNFCHRYLFRHK